MSKLETAQTHNAPLIGHGEVLRKRSIVVKSTRKRIAELKRAELKNIVYKAIIGKCEARLFPSGHHFAQQLTEAVCEAIIPHEKES